MSNEEMSEVKTSDTPYRDPAQIKFERKMKFHRGLVWFLGLIIAVNTAAAIFIGQVFERPNYNTGASDIRNAITSYEANDRFSTTVYQQMVSNGWVTRDLLETIGNQNATIIEQNDNLTWIVGVLLFNILFTLGWLSIALIRLGLMKIDQNKEYLERK